MGEPRGAELSRACRAKGCGALGGGKAPPTWARSEVGCPLCSPFWADPFFAGSSRVGQCRKARLFSPLQPSDLNGRAVAGGSRDCPCKKRVQPLGTPFIPVGENTPGCVRPGSTSFNPSTLGWRTPHLAAPVAGSQALGSYCTYKRSIWRLRGSGACKTLWSSLFKPTTCRLLGAQPSLRLPGGYLRLSCSNWEKAQLKAVPSPFGGPTPWPDPPARDIDLQGLLGGVLRLVLPSGGTPPPLGARSSLQPSLQLQSPKEQDGDSL